MSSAGCLLKIPVPIGQYRVKDTREASVYNGPRVRDKEYNGRKDRDKCLQSPIKCHNFCLSRVINISVFEYGLIASLFSFYGSGAPSTLNELYVPDF